MSGTGSVAVHRVASRADWNAFLDAPANCQGHDPMWVPPLRFMERETLHPEKNPWFSHGDAAFFVVLRAGKALGRISAQVDHSHLERHKDDTGFFGFFECIDDQDVADDLFAAATEWLRAQGMKRCRGPFGLNINSESGLLVDGFNCPPRMMMGHAQPHYAALVEKAGFAKAVDMFSYLTPQDTGLPYKQLKWLRRALNRDPRLGLRHLDPKHYDRDIATIVRIFNAAWAENWGFIPMTEADVRHLAAELKPILVSELVWFGTVDGEPAAMCVALPDLNEMIRDLGGRLLPFNWAKLAWRILNKTTYCSGTRVPLMGVMPEYKNKPMGSILALMTVGAVRDESLKLRLPVCEMSWVLENNTQTRHSIEDIGGRIYKTYRMYERAI